MKVLLLGADGMLGSDLKQVLDNDDNFNATTLGFEDLNVTDDEAVKTVIGGKNFEVVINATGYTDVDRAEEEQSRAMKVNAEAVKYLAVACKQIDARLVHFSTDYVFVGDKQEGYLENDVSEKALSVYGESKRLGEKEFLKSGVEGYLIRTSWLYGKNGKNFIETMIRLGNERDDLGVVDDQHGAPTYTHDLAKATRNLLIDEAEEGVYHLVNSGDTTWFGLAKKTFDLLEIEIDLKAISSDDYRVPAKRPEWSVLKNTKRPALRNWEAALEAYLVETGHLLR